jgi:ribose 5-phosphate isomerase B
MVAIASDHAGVEIKSAIIRWFNEHEIPFIDFGTDSTESVDYPDYAHKVCGSILDEECIMGVLICGTGNGICMSANKWFGIRASLCWNPEIAILSRQHNDSNIVCLPGRFLTEDESIQIVDCFLDTEFEGGRHEIRVSKINPTF